MSSYFRIRCPTQTGLGVQCTPDFAKDADSFGNGALALVYPAYYYAPLVEEDPVEFVRDLTSFTHAHKDALKAVTLLISFFESPRTLLDYPIMSEDGIRQLYNNEPHATAYTTLETALFIADVDTEKEVIRRGVWIGGDTDSTLSTAMLLWSIKQACR